MANGDRPATTAAERLARLRLARSGHGSGHIGPVAFRQLLQRYGSAGRALAALPEIARRRGRPPPHICSMAAAQAELEQAAELGMVVIVYGDRDYPVGLAAIDDPPPVLFLRGRKELPGKPALAIVGSRNASLNGRKLARRFAADIGAAGFTIVSGLARGIDGEAHAGSLATGTVAVLGGGADVVYPPQHRALYERVAREGAILSEQKPGQAPLARLFPRRNRIVSGLSLGVLVVEAAAQSGALITARHAADQGREVFAVPGSPAEARSRGTNQLLRDGATLAETPADVLDVLHSLLNRRTRLPVPAPPPASLPEPPANIPEPPENIPEPDDTMHRAVLACLSTHSVSVDDIALQCDLPAAIVRHVLLEHEVSGRIHRQADGFVVSSEPGLPAPGVPAPESTDHGPRSG